jgi:hypothetical protein
VGALALALLNLGIGGLSLLPIHPSTATSCLSVSSGGRSARRRGPRRIIKRVGTGLLAVDLSFAVLLLAERPVIGRR